MIFLQKKRLFMEATKTKLKHARMRIESILNARAVYSFRNEAHE